MYVNGVSITAYSSPTYPPLNLDTAFNTAAIHTVGTRSTPVNYFSGYLADIHFIDGQALTPSSFGEFDATTGVWNPKAYTGTYGTNGFHLDFADNSAATATTLGKDSAGSNNWTPNNLSVTAGAGNDSLVDSPTNGTASSGGDAGGVVVGNYCTWNPVEKSTANWSPYITISNGNLDMLSTATVSGPGGTIGTPSSGKWYWEITMSYSTASPVVGFKAMTATAYDYPGYAVDTYGYRSSGLKQAGGSSAASYGATYTASDVIGVAINVDTGEASFYKNGVSQGVAFTGLSSLKSWSPYVGSTSGDVTFTLNAGQRPFAYAAPAGFKSLNTANLPTPTILKGSDYFDTKLYTGNGSTQTISGLGFSPDLVWLKGRSGATDHALYDTVRGATFDFASNLAAAETTQSTGLTAFSSNGFSIGALAKLNTNTATYAGWCWDSGTSTYTDTQGTQNAMVRVNTVAGFSIQTWSKSASRASSERWGHGLGVVPELIIIKTRNGAICEVWHKALTFSQYLVLDQTSGVQTVLDKWGLTGPSSSLVYYYTGTGLYNYVSYTFAPVAGYSAFGSYTGNGSTDGPFVYTGFRPAFVIVKMSSSTGNWTMLDSKREGYNVDNDPLYPNLANAEGTTDLIDITSNGFKVRTTDATFNTNTGTYVYACFAENPFSIARAR